MGGNENELFTDDASWQQYVVVPPIDHFLRSPICPPPLQPSMSSPADASASTLKISTSPQPGSRLAMEVVVDSGRCKATYETALQRLSRSIKLPGFRKGKVPRPVLMQQLGPARIRASALEELVESAIRDALKQEEIPAIGSPELKDGFEAVLERFQPDAELVFTLEMDVEPTPSLRNTRGLKAEAEAVAFDPSQIDELLDQSRRKLATLVPVEGRGAASGDVALVSFEGRFVDNDEPVEGGSSDGMDVELEEGKMIPGFVEGILGMAIGENRDVECTFPESYPQKEAAGRKAVFSIVLKDLKCRELPDLDDAFAQQASDHETLAELRDDLEKRLKEDAENRHRQNRRDALLEALVKELDVDLPETLLQQEVRSLIEQTAGQIAQQGMDVKKLFTADLIRTLSESSRPEAEQRLRRRFALKALATAESIEVASDAIDERIQDVRRSLKDTSRIDPQRLREAVIDELLEDALLEWLESNSTISETAPGSDSVESVETSRSRRPADSESPPTPATDASDSKEEEPID